MQTSTETTKTKTPRAAKAKPHTPTLDKTRAARKAKASSGLGKSEPFQNPAPHSETKVLPTPKVAKAPRVAKAKAPPAPKGQTKSAQVIALLSRTKGATNAEIMEATSWQTHSVRGFLAQLKKNGHTVITTVGGTPPVTTYRIAADEAV